MKKRIMAFALAAVLCLGMAACGKEKGGTGVANPQVESSEEDIAELGVCMTAPAAAEDTKYFILDKTIGQIDFKADGAKYTYRGAETEDDISGVYEEFEESPVSMNVSVTDRNVEITLKKIVKGGYLALWRWENISYSLYTAEEVEESAVTELATELAQSSCPE